MHPCKQYVSMDLLEGIEVDPIRRSRRVRSWYLYEQYKALERNQQEAAWQLNNKTSQDRLLYRELSEHRQRRKMCSECHSEPGIDYIRNGDKRSCVTMSINDIYESLCDLHDENHDTGETSLQESCLWSQTISETFKMEEDSEQKEYICNSETYSVPQLNLDDPDFLFAASSGNLADDVKEELEFVKRSIDENIHLQLEMKANVQSLEDYTKPPESLYEDKLVKFKDKASFEDVTSKYAADIEDSCDEDSLCSLRPRSMPDKIDSNCNMHALWTKFVSFAYQVVQLNHGNCYYDYSSQFMTAVLACDILRRGIGRMCNVLQPYVSPIKCVSSCVATTPNSNNTVIKKERSIKSTPSEIQKNTNRYLELKLQGKLVQKNCLERLNIKSSRTHGEETSRSSKTWRQCSSEKCGTKTPLQSQAWHSLSSRGSITFPRSKYSSTAWHEQSCNGSEFNNCRKRVTNPMLKLAKYIDSIVQDIDRDDL